MQDIFAKRDSCPAVSIAAVCGTTRKHGGRSPCRARTQPFAVGKRRRAYGAGRHGSANRTWLSAGLWLRSFRQCGRRIDKPTAARGTDAGVYRSGLRQLGRVEAITRRTVACGSRTCRVIAAGPRPASEAARISRSCPSVTVVAVSGAPDFGPTGILGPDFCDRRAPAAGGLCPASRPRRRSSAATAFARRSSCPSSSRRSDRPRSLGRARLGALAGRSAPGARGPRIRRPASLTPVTPIPRHHPPYRPCDGSCPVCPLARKVFTVPKAGGRNAVRYEPPSRGESHSG